MLILAVGFSALQYQKNGSVSWPSDLLRYIEAHLTEQLSDPDRVWHKAADLAERLGANREGLPPPAFDIRGRVVRVADGDTVSVLDENNKQHKVRLFGIDTPERNQPHGSLAGAALADLVDGERVGVVVVETDSYGREVGTLYRGSTNINQAMVAAGHAWWYAYYAPDEHPLRLAQDQARAQGRGLWAQPNPVPPWDWRRRQRQRQR